MKISYVNIKRIRIDELEGIDPITVYVEDYETGKGKIIIEVSGEAFSSYWGAMGGERYCSVLSSLLG